MYINTHVINIYLVIEVYNMQIKVHIKSNSITHCWLQVGYLLGLLQSS